MNVNIVEWHRELAEPIEHSLVFAPVVILAPVIDHSFQIAEIGSKGPTGIRNFVGPTRCIEAPLKVEQRGLLDRNPEGLRRYAALCERSYCHLDFHQTGDYIV